MAITHSLRRYIYNSALLYNIRITLALIGSTAFPLWFGEITLTIPLTLGVVAAALTDLDGNLTGRVINLFTTLLCFFVASVSIELLIPYPLYFGIGLFFSTCGFILLGSLGQRYATIAFGALLIAVYTMLGSDMYPVWYQQPLLLLSGALWYNLLSLSGHILFSRRPLEDTLARCYQDLAVYLSAKANLYDPDIENEKDMRQALIDVTMANRKLVVTLNQTKAALLTRITGDRGRRSVRKILQYYFIAQDIHERASSNYLNYAALSEQLRHSDALFRIQRLLSMQSLACQQIAQSILLHQKYKHDSRFERAFHRLNETLERITVSDSYHPLSNSLRYQLQNLSAIDVQLSNIDSDQTQTLKKGQEEDILFDDRISGWGDIVLRIRTHLTPRSPLFRHAIRMSLVLCGGYTFIQYTGITHGYWIMLTSLFVCQPNYHATRTKLVQRVIGTLAGIIIGLPVLYFVPAEEGQLLLIVISGLLFFIFRNINYGQSTMFITLLVLLCFNLLGDGYEVIIPRIYDTVLGCLGAWAAVTFIWPDWKFNQLPAMVRKALVSDYHYLDAIQQQYHQGKNNALTYRIARREAHNSDAELAAVVSNMPLEPRYDRALYNTAFRLLCLNQMLISYISTLGSHREKITNPHVLKILDDTVCYVDGKLHTDACECHEPHTSLVALSLGIQQFSPSATNKELLILQQINLLLELLPELLTLKKHIMEYEVTAELI